MSEFCILYWLSGRQTPEIDINEACEKAKAEGKWFLLIFTRHGVVLVK